MGEGQVRKGKGSCYKYRFISNTSFNKDVHLGTKDPGSSMKCEFCCLNQQRHWAALARVHRMLWKKEILLSRSRFLYMI